MGNQTIPPTRPADKALLEELRALRAEQATTNRRLSALYHLLDDFIRAYLPARFPYGRPDDRFAQQRRLRG